MKTGGKGSDTHSIFHEYAHADLAPEDLTERAITQMAGLLVGAALETTGATLSACHYYLCANPIICGKLRAELAMVWTGKPSGPSWKTLDKLPYLKGVINEALRLSPSVMGRMARVNHQTDMKIKDWTIPRGTAVSMSLPLINMNPELFPEPDQFEPERWTQGEKSKQLEAYFIPFSRGSRACLGYQ